MEVMLMIKKLVLVVVVLMMLLSLVLPATTMAGSVYVEQKTVFVNVGDTFTVTLEQNASTGYRWSYTITDPSVVQLVKVAYTQAKPIPGAPNNVIYTFQGVKSGIATITFTYARSFAPDSNTKTIFYTVNVARKYLFPPFLYHSRIITP
jgi:predicted secreted protein